MRRLMSVAVMLAFACGGNGGGNPSLDDAGVTDVQGGDHDGTEAGGEGVDAADRIAPPDPGTDATGEDLAQEAGDPGGEDATTGDPGAEDPAPGEAAGPEVLVEDQGLSDPAPDAEVTCDCAGIVCGHTTCVNGACRCDCAASEGFALYECPGGIKVPWCACTTLGVHCIEHPEYQCPTLCRPDQEVPLPCPDGQATPCLKCVLPECEPVCGEGGWHDPCTGELLLATDCEGCEAVCSKVGSKSEGWIDSCAGLIRWDQCAPRFGLDGAPSCKCQSDACEAGQAALFPCPAGGSVPWCECVGGVWTCVDSPWEACDTPLPCIPEGGLLDFDDSWQTCCPGLVPIDAAVWTGTDCATPGVAARRCTLCGDGECKLPENECNCPADCHGHPGPVPFLELCWSSIECAPGLVCEDPLVSPWAAGVCTHTCLPGSEDPALSCGDAAAICSRIPLHAAAGYCLLACESNEVCPWPLTCAVGDPDQPGTGGCLVWPETCDPIDNLYCAPSSQCRIVDGAPACGQAGTLAQGDACVKGAGDLCGPGLVCGAIDRCWPVCQSDNWCQDAHGLDFCLKAAPSDPDAWGHCMVLE